MPNSWRLLSACGMLNSAQQPHALAVQPPVDCRRGRWTGATGYRELPVPQAARMNGALIQSLNETCFKRGSVERSFSAGTCVAHSRFGSRALTRASIHQTEPTSLSPNRPSVASNCKPRVSILDDVIYLATVNGDEAESVDQHGHEEVRRGRE